MSKRSHHRRSDPVNVSELAEALTRNGWQPPRQPGFPPAGNGGAPNQMNGLAALGGLMGNGGGFPPLNQMAPFQNPGTVTDPAAMGGAAPFPQMMAPPPFPAAPGPRPGAQPTRVSDSELLKKLFQEILTLLKEK